MLLLRRDRGAGGRQAVLSRRDGTRHRSSAVAAGAGLCGADRLRQPVSVQPAGACPGVAPLDFLVAAAGRASGPASTSSPTCSATCRSARCCSARWCAAAAPARRAAALAVGRRRAAVAGDGVAAELPAAARRRRNVDSALNIARHGARRRCSALALHALRRGRALAGGARPLVHRPQRRRPGAAAAVAGRAAVPDRRCRSASARCWPRLQRRARRAAVDGHARPRAGSPWLQASARRRAPLSPGRRARWSSRSACSRRACSRSRSRSPGWRRARAGRSARRCSAAARRPVDRAQLRPEPRAAPGSRRARWPALRARHRRWRLLLSLRAAPRRGRLRR